MFICNHTIAGAAIGLVLKDHPVLAFGAGFVSHLALDAIPHWGLPGNHPQREEEFLVVAKRDGCAGCALSLALIALAPQKPAMIAAIAGATLPDIDKPSEHFFGKNPVPRRFQRFHVRIQKESPKRLRQEILTAIIGSAAILGATYAVRRASK